MYRIELSAIPAFGTAITLEPAIPGDTMVCYVFADGCLGDADLTAVRPVIDRHAGTSDEFAAVMHLGSALHPLLLGKPEFFGNTTIQQKRLDDFMQAIPDTLGAFGSWWPETFAHIRSIGALCGDAAVQICLFVRSASVLPLEWNPHTIDSWLTARSDRSSRVTIIREPADAADSVAFSDWVALGDWVADAPRGLEREPRTAIIVDTAGRHLPLPIIGLPDAGFLRQGVRMLEISLPLGWSRSGRRLTLARLAGVAPSEIRVRFR